MLYRLFLLHIISTFIVIGAIAQNPTFSNADSIRYLYNKEHQLPRMRFKVLYSNVRDHFTLISAFKSEITAFGKEKYESLKPLILEKDIPYLQKLIDDKKEIERIV